MNLLLILRIVIGILHVQNVPTIVRRAEWGARPPTQINKMKTPVPYVVIHHSEIPGACNVSKTCEASMRSMQNYHMDDRGWTDIGYSFAVGGDNRAYEGRGWDRIGAHAIKYNSRSIGICVIGSWTTAVPPDAQLEVVKELIDYGVTLGRISRDYKLIGHRQASSTECPGDAFYDEIKTWPHWVATPDANG